MAKISILHISDIHIGNTYRKKVEDIALQIVDALEVHDKKVDCVVVSGDIFDGKYEKEDRIEKALRFFNCLKEELKLFPLDFVFVPGNHDLIRKEENIDWNNYKTFLESFYGKENFLNIYDNEFLFCTKIYNDKNIAILGLNSCMLESCKLEEKDIKWLEDIDCDEEAKQKIEIAIKNKKKKEWDDYGYISKKQLRKSFKKLEEELHDLTNYTIVTCFHHHFYPFPEIYNQYGDKSIIRNFTDVIEKFQQKNVKLVLHGHKHLPIIRPVANHKYLNNPESIFYVLSAGSIGKNDIDNRSFQQIDVYSPNSLRLADICRFNYKIEELQNPEIYSIPPKKSYEQNTFVEIYNLFKEEYPEEYEIYKQDIYECDSISQQNRIDDIIKNISQIITQFDSIKKGLKNSCENILMVLYAIHYRVNHLTIRNSKDKYSKNIINLIKEKLSNIFDDTLYMSTIQKLLESKNNKDFEKLHDELFSKYIKYNEYTSHIAIAIFFTDLYLTFIKYGEIYFNTEKLKHKVNIKLETDSFHENIPVSTIKLTSNIDRRQAIISFKCKNPTVHKIAVLIVKDFEQRINKIEDSFKYLGLKLYYISPKVEKVDYNLENLNFEAYIPTLLPLLTGENLYKEREVFSRELIQNSLDAILLRNKIMTKLGKALSDEEKIIKIELGFCTNPQNGKVRKYLKIIDNGIGMDSFKIERYFTSIGRSFYQSDEFEELQKTEEIRYNPISNFGIGFLSAFMVGSEIEVLTKSFEHPEYALEIHIPNYEGCFFIRKKEDKDKLINIGTTITLYEDERTYLDPNKIINYIKKTFIDFQLKIEIENKIGGTVEKIDSYSLRRDKKIILFCPIENEKVKYISWKNEIQNGIFIDKYNFGILIKFDPLFDRNNNSNFSYYLNSGILLSESNTKKMSFKETPYSKFYYNFPSSLVNLDVARENILDFKNINISKAEIIDILARQGLELINDIHLNKRKIPLKIINNLVLFFKQNDVSKNYQKEYNKNLYFLDLESIDYIKLKKGIETDQYFFTKNELKNMINIYYNVVSKFADNFLNIENFETYKNWFISIYNQVIDSTITGKQDNVINKQLYSNIRYKLEKYAHENRNLNPGIKINFKESYFDKEKIYLRHFEEVIEIFNHNIKYIWNDKYPKEELRINKLYSRFEYIEEIEIVLDRFIEKIFDKKYSKTDLFLSKDKYYNILSLLILFDFIIHVRKRKGEYFILDNIIAIFEILSEYIKRTVNITNATNFKIVL